MLKFHNKQCRHTVPTSNAAVHLAMHLLSLNFDWKSILHRLASYASAIN